MKNRIYETPAVKGLMVILQSWKCDARSGISNAIYVVRYDARSVIINGHSDMMLTPVYQ